MGLSERSMSQYDVIVIGAGISGLSFAHYCGSNGIKTLVIEKSDQVGGTLHSHCFEDTDGFWLELGAHTCYNSYLNLLAIMENADILDRLTPREKVPFMMLVDSRIKSFPSQVNLLELLLSAPRLFTMKPQGQSVESYYSKITGLSNFRRVIGPAISGVLSQTANAFPAELVFKKRSRRKDIPKKFTLSGGLQTAAKAIAAQKNFDLLTGSEVLAVASKGSGFQVATGGTTYETNALALATPASAAAKLMQGPFPAVAGKLSLISCASVESVGVALDRKMVRIAPVAGLIPASDSFYSVVTRDTVQHDRYRGFTFHFKPGLAGREAKLRRIAEVLGVQQDQLEHIVEKENYVPSLRVGHNDLTLELDQSISGARLFITGNYFGGMAIEDCVTRSYSEFKRLKGIL